MISESDTRLFSVEQISRKFSAAAIEVNVLIVDDLVPNLISLEAALGGENYHLIQAQSGKEALQYAEKIDFAVILLDVQMPGMNGFETAQKIRTIERARHTPIIFLTAQHPVSEFVLHGYEVGCVDYLFKPLNINILRAKIAVFVDLFMKNQEIEHQSKLLLKIERQAKEQELWSIKRSSEKRYQNLVEGIKEGIVWSAEAETLKISFVSPYAEKISGFDCETWMNELNFWEHHLHPEDKDNVLKVFEAAAQFSGQSEGVEHRFVKPDGEIIWLYTEIHCEYNEKHAKELQGLSFNITHLKETEKALREAVRVRDEFLSIASHELHTPITPLQLQMEGFLYMLENGKLDNIPVAELTHMLEISNAQVSRLSRLIAQLLDVSRINAGRLGLQYSEINLSRLIYDMVNQLQYEVRIANCTLKMDIEPNVVGEWDGLRLERVIVNLLTNSFKYGAGKSVEIKLSSIHDKAKLQVKDFGMGIAPKDHKRIFEQFERAVSVKHFGGLGLGLFITRRIIELHGGSIKVESELNQGANFIVELPLKRQSYEKHPCH